MIPLGISIMRDELPAERLAAATALMSASLGIGGALGLPAAALLAEHADWHVLVWTSAGLGVLATALVVRLVPESAVRTGGRFDLVGAARLSVALVCLLLAISKGADWGWTGGRTTGLFAAAVAVLLRGGAGNCAARSRWWTSAPPPGARCCSPTSPRPSSASRCSPCRCCSPSWCSCRRPPATGWDTACSPSV